MENLLYGLVVMVICVIGYGIAWKSFMKKSYTISLFIIIFCGFLLRGYVASEGHLHEWDERYHALVAKNLTKHPLKPTLYEKPLLPYDYKNWGGNHIWLHKQPLALWCMAASISVFGLSELAVRLPSILFSTIGIYLVFQVALYFFNYRVAFLTAFLYSIHGLMIELVGGRVSTDHIDVCFSFFILLSVYFSVTFFKDKHWLRSALIGLSVGLTILSKWLPALIVLPIWLCLCMDAKMKIIEIIKHFILILLVATLVFLPWQIYIADEFPLESAWESHYNFLH